MKWYFVLILGVAATAIVEGKPYHEYDYGQYEESYEEERAPKKAASARVESKPYHEYDYGQYEESYEEERAPEKAAAAKVESKPFKRYEHDEYDRSSQEEKGLSTPHTEYESNEYGSSVEETATPTVIHCKPGSSFQVNCNICSCLPNGGVVCTQVECGYLSRQTGGKSFCCAEVLNRPSSTTNQRPPLIKPSNKKSDGKHFCGIDFVLPITDD